LDFHKNGMPNPAGENVTGALKPTGLPIVIEIRIQREQKQNSPAEFYRPIQREISFQKLLTSP
jgi:hypothetical protein